MTLNTFSSGVNTSFSTELNENFKSSKINTIYTGTGFDLSVSGALQDTSNSYEFTSLSSSDLEKSDYLIIDLLIRTKTTGDDLTTSTCYLTLETKEIGGSYSDSFPETAISTSQSGGSSKTITTDIIRNFTWVHELTAGEKANGIQVKVTTRGVTGNDTSNQVIVTNKQSVLKNGY